MTTTIQAHTEMTNGPFTPYQDVIQTRKILIVDDELGVRKSLGLYLSKTGFSVEEAENGLAAKEILKRDEYFLVITDITMPGMSGLDLLVFIQSLDREMDTVMITGHMGIDFAIDAIKRGAFDYLKKPFLLEDVRTTVLRVLEKQVLKRKSIELERLKERQKIQSKNLTEFMIILANIIDAKSPFTRVHSERVSEYSLLIAREIGLPEDELEHIALGAKLHDIGKLGTPDYILNKDGPLTKDEYETIKEHPKKGAELIEPISSLKHITDIIHYHHENLDGSGYPDGLVGEEIPLHARIVKIADYWDAITSTRPYRKPMSHDKAMEILRSEATNNKVEFDLVNALFSRISLLPV